MEKEKSNRIKRVVTIEIEAPCVNHAQIALQEATKKIGVEVETTYRDHRSEYKYKITDESYSDGKPLKNDFGLK